MILAGIDEAGLGPILGPLVVSAGVFRCAGPVDIDADGLCTTDLWDLLRRCVATKANKRQPERLVIADSKKLLPRRKDADGNARRDMTALERGVLAMWLATPDGQALDRCPATLAEFLNAVSAAVPGFEAAVVRASACPWYGSCDLSLPHAASGTDIELVANGVRVACRQADVELLGMRAEPLFAGEFNRLIERVQNKATVTFDRTCRLISWVLGGAGTEDLHLTIDRQGGRVHYLPTLQRMCPDGHWRVLAETDHLSAYRMARGEQTVNLAFATKAESKSLPTALASMLSKYIREACMVSFNAFWAERVEGLAPTAGYYTDGKRFLDEVRPALAPAGVAESEILRSR